MRIGMILTSDFPPDSRVEKEALSLINAGHEIFILCLKYKKNIKNEQFQGIHIIRNYLPNMVNKKLFAFIITIPIYSWIWRKWIRRFIREYKIEILHVHDLPLCGEGIRLAKESKIDIVADMHENYPELIRVQQFSNTLMGKLLISKKKWYRKEKEWLNNINNIICVEKEMKDRMSAFAKNAQFHIVPNTPNINHMLSKQRNNPDIANNQYGKFNLFYFGKTDNARGINVLIEAVEYIKIDIPEIHVIIIGSGIALQDYKKQSAAKGLKNHISFEGWRPENELEDYMKHVDISIIPHIKSEQTDNSSPNKLFISMAFGKPVIVSNCNSIVRVVNDCNCGLVFENKNAKHLAEQVVKLFRDNKLRKEFSINAKEAIEKKYNWNVTVKPLVDLYAKLKDSTQ